MSQKEIYINYIIECFNKGIVERSDVMATFGKKWPTPKRTFDRYLKTAKEKYTEQMQTTTEALNKEIVKGKVEALKKGIKTKNERILEKQKDIERLREVVDNGKTDDFYIYNGLHVFFERPLTETEKANILKRASEIEVEISKIEGDYAAQKIEGTIISPTVVVDISEE